MSDEDEDGITLTGDEATNTDKQSSEQQLLSLDDSLHSSTGTALAESDAEPALSVARVSGE